MSLLPPNSTKFERSLESVCRSNMTSPIRHLLNPSICPANLLHVMALTLQVDQWDQNWSYETKVNTLQDAFSVHRIRGTPASIKRVLKNAGYGDARLEEADCDSIDWFQYNIYMTSPITILQAKQVRGLLEATAPLHCQLVGLHFNEVAFVYDGTIDFNGQYAFGSNSGQDKIKRSVIYGRT